MTAVPLHKEEQSGGPPTRLWLVTLLVIVAAALLIRLDLFRGYVGLDDAEYARFAERLARGTMGTAGYTGPAVFPLRVGIIAPTALLFRAFGVSDWTMVLYPLLLSLAEIVLAWLCARILFGWRAGLVAAALLAVFPWDIDSATKLLPDLPAAVYVAAAVTMLIAAEQRQMQRTSRLFAVGLLAGLALGTSWLCKESTAYLAPFCGLWLVISVRERRTRAIAMWAGVAAGSLGVLLAEMAVYHHLTGDFLFRLHEMERNYRQWPNSFFTEGSDSGWKHGESARAALVRRLFMSGPAVILFSPTFLYLPFVGLAATLFAGFRRDRAFLVPGLWLWTLVLMFNFGSSSTTTYMPLALFHRYLYPIFFPAVILVAGFLERTVFASSWRSAGEQLSPTRWLGLVAGACIALVGARQLRFNLTSRETWLAEVRSLKNAVTPTTLVYSDALSLRTFEFLHAYPARTAWKDLSTVGQPNDLPDGSLVLVYPPGIEWLQHNGGMWVAWPAPGPTARSGYLSNPFYKDPPSTWKLIRRQGAAFLYLVQNPRTMTLAGERLP